MTLPASEFARCQPDFAAHGIATFPVRVTPNGKNPAIKNYLRVGLPASARLVRDSRFANADAFGFALGARSKITVLDIDTSDERVLIDSLDRHGKTPLIVRSGSGHFQA